MDHSTSSTGTEKLTFSGEIAKVSSLAWMAGGIGIVATILLSFFSMRDAGAMKRFSYSYLISFMFILSISLGGLFFTVLQHLVKAGWSVSVRRIAEWLAASMPIVGVMSLPIVLPVLLHSGVVYSWASGEKHEHKAEVASTQSAHAEGAAGAEASGEEEELSGFKAFYLSPLFWTVRVAAYFFVWSFIGIWYWRNSLMQDSTGDIAITNKLQFFAPICMILFAVTLTGASFDFLMALDATWSSTIFGVYYFAGCALAVFASLIIIAHFLQKFGYVTKTISIEHFHDLGKFLFAFTFFWGYIGFSQYMLMWYANLPEETGWWYYHGASGAKQAPGAYTPVLIALMVGHLFIPFAGLLSRHVKRNPKFLCFWAFWLLAFQWLDMYWIVMPELKNGRFYFNLIDIAALVGLLGIYIGFVISRATQGALRPLQDPRLTASLEFQNI